MANTSTRTLRLLSLFQTHKYWPGNDLAERLGVSARTLRRDIDRLRELGYPVEAQRGVDGGYQLAAGAALPPLMVDDDEAVALVIGLQFAMQDMTAGVAEPSVRALAKVVQVMPPRLRRRVEAIHAMTVPAGWGEGRSAPGPDSGILTTVALACRDSQRLRFAYTAADGTRTERHIEPYRLVSLGRRWYLVAFDLIRHDWRSFRIDRLTGPEGDGSRFRPRDLPTSDAAEFVRSRVENMPRPHRIEVLVDAPAETVARSLGRWGAVEAIGTLRCRVSMTTDSFDWPTMMLGSLDADFHILEPPELIAYVQGWGERFRRAHPGAADSPVVS